MQQYLTVNITKHSRGWNVYKTYTHGSQSGGKTTLQWAIYEAFDYGKKPESGIVTINNKNYKFTDLLPMIKSDYIKQNILKII